MIEDKLLTWRFRNGSPDALERLYGKYHRSLLTLAAALLNDIHEAEDTVHDFFVSFAGCGPRLKIEGSLKAYLFTCVANRARDRLRAARRRPVLSAVPETASSGQPDPPTAAICNEAMLQIGSALSQLPYEQREVVILHTWAAMKFRTIAAHQKVSIQTVQSRYRYGLEKLRVLLDGQV